MMSRLAAAVFLALVCGCGGDSGGRRAISGRVTFDGKPVVYGIIQFSPDNDKGGSGPQGSGEIRNGSYRTNPDFGATPGPHIARLTGFAVGPEGGMMPPALFSEYSVPVEIPATGSAEFNFDVPASAAPKPK